MIDNGLTRRQWNCFMKLSEVTWNPVRWDGLLVLTADNRVVIQIVGDVLIHGERGH